MASMPAATEPIRPTPRSGKPEGGQAKASARQVQNPTDSIQPW